MNKEPQLPLIKVEELSWKQASQFMAKAMATKKSKEHPSGLGDKRRVS